MDPLQVIGLKELDVDEILLDVISRVQKLAKNKNLNVKVEIVDHSEKKPIFGDFDLLFNLFFNLLENAVKYSQPEKNIYITLTWNQTESVVDIVDEGIGIPPDKATTIFDRFSRVDPSSNTMGFGLGLAIAKKIADLPFSKTRPSMISPTLGSFNKLSFWAVVSIFSATLKKQRNGYHKTNFTFFR